MAPLFQEQDQRLREVKGSETAELGAWPPPLARSPSPSTSLGAVVYPRDRRGGPGEAGALGGAEGGRPALGQGKCLQGEETGGGS